MSPSSRKALLIAAAAVLAGSTFLYRTQSASKRAASFDDAISDNARRLLADGRQIFRYDTFGDQDFWGGTLRLHESVAQLSPAQALGLGLKVDAEALPPNLVERIRRGSVDLNDPATTLQLLKKNAVVGVTGFFGPDGHLQSVGLQCAICHSAVDDSVAPGVGRRLDGWANRDLNVGAIIASAPGAPGFLASLLGVDEATVLTVLRTWGPGKFDAELLLDGKAFRPDGGAAATLIPPAFGLAGVNQHT
jgi:hypothetical protein